MNLREVGRGALWFAIGLIVAAVPVLLWHQQPGPGRDVTIRSYQVAPEIAGEMKSALSDTLTGQALGRVSLTADGRLLVAAPESVQKGVESIVADVEARKPAPTPTIRFEAWLVSAIPGTAGTADGPGLAEVAAALAGIRKSTGPQRFELIEKLALQARAGNDDNEVQGAHGDMRITPTVRHDPKGDAVIAARVSFRLSPVRYGVPGPPGALKALTELRPGELLVIGQSNLPGANASDSAPETQVYYILRASL